MRALLSLTRREFAAYFLSPIAYVTIAVFLVITGALFYLTMAKLTEAGPRGTEYPMQLMFGGSGGRTEEMIAGVFFWFLLPALTAVFTMRLLAEERARGTLEMLLTAPIRDWQVVAGKYAACLLFYLLLWVPTLAYLPVLLNLHAGSLERLLTDPLFGLAVSAGWLLVYGLLLLVGPGGAGRLVLLLAIGAAQVAIAAAVGAELNGVIGAAVAAGATFGGLVLVYGVPYLLAALAGLDTHGRAVAANWAAAVVGLLGVVASLVLAASRTPGSTAVTVGIDPWPVVTSYLGVVLAGAMFLALGLFVSSQVQDQLVAWLLSMLLGLVFVAPGYAAWYLGSGSPLYPLAAFLGVPEHFRRDFTRGVIDTRHLVLYLSVTAFCLFLTVRSLEARRLRA